MHVVPLLREWLRTVPLVLFLLLVGCASHSSRMDPVVAELAGQNYDGALQLLDEEKLPERDRLLLLMNRGMLLRLKGEFAASNREFESAKRLVDELNALSLREQALALTVNDATRSYAGAPYEQVFLNIYSALNYLDLGDFDAARVEVLQVDVKLAELAGQEVGPLFENDPLARYLSGLIYEAGGEYSDAMIAYRRAFQAYQQHAGRYPLAVPQQLKIDLLRSSERVGLEDENRRFREQFGIEQWLSAERLAEKAELVFLFHNGLAPVKVERSLTVPMPRRNQLVRIALPEYLPRATRFSVAQVMIGGQERRTELAENVAELAIAELEANLPAITARTAARAFIKYKVSRETGKQNDLAGLLVNLAGVLTERADTRSWLSLPAQIQLARVPLEPGEYSLQVELLDQHGRVAKRLDFPTLSLRAGEKRFLSCHAIDEASFPGVNP